MWVPRWSTGWGGILVIEGSFTIGDIVAFVAYLTQLYTPLQALTNAPVDFAQSIVSFERVFEIIDLPLEIAEKDDAIHLRMSVASWFLMMSAFITRSTGRSYSAMSNGLGRIDNVAATRSGAAGAQRQWSSTNRYHAPSAGIGVGGHQILY